MALAKNRRWFGPAKAMRLGIRPVSWQGAVVCLLFVGLLLADLLFVRSLGLQLLAAVGLVIAFGIIAFMRGGRPNNSVFG